MVNNTNMRILILRIPLPYSMKRKDVKRMTKEHDNTRSIAFTYKLILSIIAFFLIFMVAMVLGAADTSIKDVWSALTSSAKGIKYLLFAKYVCPVKLPLFL